MPNQEESKIKPDKPEIKQEIARTDEGKFVKGKSGNPNGKPRGRQNKKTIKKKIVEDEFKNRILTNIYELLTAQMNVAKGTSYLYKIVTRRGIKGGEGRREHILVTDPYEIKDFLDELEGESGVNPNLDNDDYYYISTKQPDNRALDSLINRVFGPPKQEVDLTTNNEPIKINIVNYGDTTPPQVPAKDIPGPTSKSA